MGKGGRGNLLDSILAYLHYPPALTLTLTLT